MPFDGEHIKQSALEAQYEILKARGIYSDKEIAIHLARFVEARIIVAADRRVTELEEVLNKRLAEFVKLIQDG